MIQHITRTQMTAYELSSGLVANDNATCVHAYAVPTPNANVAPMKCTTNMVSTCPPITVPDNSGQPITVQSYSGQSQQRVTFDNFTFTVYKYIC